MPNSMKIVYVLALMNAIMGLGIMFVCFCRTVVASQRVLGRVRLKFIVLGPAGLALGFSPWWGNLPGYSETFMLAAVLIGLLAETYQWRKGPPDSVSIDTMPGDLYVGFVLSWPQRIKSYFRTFVARFKAK